MRLSICSRRAVAHHGALDTQPRGRHDGYRKIDVTLQTRLEEYRRLQQNVIAALPLRPCLEIGDNGRMHYRIETPPRIVVGKDRSRQSGTVERSVLLIYVVAELAADSLAQLNAAGHQPSGLGVGVVDGDSPTRRTYGRPCSCRCLCRP